MDRLWRRIFVSGIMAVVSLAAFASEAAPLIPSDFGAGGILYGMDRKQVDKAWGEPESAILPGMLKYGNGSAARFRRDKLVFLFVVHPVLDTPRGVRVSDHISKIWACYGRPADSYTDKQGNVNMHYSLKQGDDGKFDLLLDFTCRDEYVVNMSFCDYMAGHLLK